MAAKVEKFIPAPEGVGDEMHGFISELYPICRSITGDGLRETLSRIRTHVPVTIHEVPTGTEVFDWVIPKEWNIKDAYVKNKAGERVIDFRESNLHVVNYSVPVDRRMALAELRPHLHTLSEHPDWIPYRTSYYVETWGFCLSENHLHTLTEDEYDVFIDSSLEEGSLSYGEFFIQGEIADEVLISCHVCHPSLGNDNLSGLALSTFLAKRLSRQKNRYSYRFLFIPGTIGSIAWLARNKNSVQKVKHGLVVACVGDAAPFHYKKSRQDTAKIDQICRFVLETSGTEFEQLDFSPYGYDERQYCSPAFNLPVGSLTRTPHGKFPEYHTSADNLDLVRPTALAESFSVYNNVIRVLENDVKYLNTHPEGEPQLGRRGLYSALGGSQEASGRRMAILWLLNLSDGEHSLMDIAKRSGLKFELLLEGKDALVEHGLLTPIVE